MEIDPSIRLYIKEAVDETAKSFESKLQTALKDVEKLYAVKLVEKIVFGAMGFGAITILGAALTTLLI